MWKEYVMFMKFNLKQCYLKIASLSFVQDKKKKKKKKEKAFEPIELEVIPNSQRKPQFPLQRHKWWLTYLIFIQCIFLTVINPLHAWHNNVKNASQKICWDSSRRCIKIHCFGEPLFRKRTQWVGVAFKEGSLGMGAGFCHECCGTEACLFYRLTSLGREHNENKEMITWHCDVHLHIKSATSGKSCPFTFDYVWATKQESVLLCIRIIIVL